MRLRIWSRSQAKLTAQFRAWSFSAPSQVRGFSLFGLRPGVEYVGDFHEREVIDVHETLKPVRDCATDDVARYTDARRRWSQPKSMRLLSSGRCSLTQNFAAGVKGVSRKIVKWFSTRKSGVGEVPLDRNSFLCAIICSGKSFARYRATSHQAVEPLWTDSRTERPQLVGLENRPVLMLLEA